MTFANVAQQGIYISIYIYLFTYVNVCWAHINTLCGAYRKNIYFIVQLQTVVPLCSFAVAYAAARIIYVMPYSVYATHTSFTEITVVLSPQWRALQALRYVYEV